MAEEMLSPPLAPPGDTSATFLDNQAEFAQITGRTPLDEGFRRDFIARHIRRIATLPSVPAAPRSSVMRALQSQLPEDWQGIDLDSLPTPGGVGYGMFYAPAFRSAFQEGTGIYWEVAAPAAPGGNVNTTLYLTATNRAALGVEALVGYNGASTPVFFVFDWALKTAGSDPWQRKLPLSTLGAYAKSETVNGQAIPVLPVMNMTYQTDPTTWINQVWFQNQAAGRWDLVYQFSYQATLAQQLSDESGTWGPIVETFQDQYQGTNEMGALKTTLAARSNGAWGNWLPLVPAQAQLTGASKGFTADYLDPNTSWLLHS